MITNNTYFEANHSYAFYEQQNSSAHHRRCIDGKITGCGNCVGYCQYKKHPGFLTEKLRMEHYCICKGCYYYLPKPKNEKRPLKAAQISQSILNTVTEALVGYEGMRVLQADKCPSGGWQLKYVTITNEYHIPSIEKKLSACVGDIISMIRLNCDFEKAVQLIYAA